MQKLTLSLDDDLYAMLHSQVGRGNIGRFVADAIRPKLHLVSNDRPTLAFGALAHLAKPVDAVNQLKAKRDYMKRRNTAKQQH